MQDTLSSFKIQYDRKRMTEKYLFRGKTKTIIILRIVFIDFK